jgi:hypothetical protein
MLRSTRVLATFGATLLLWSGSAVAANLVTFTVLNGTPCAGSPEIRCFGVGDTVEVGYDVAFSDTYLGGSIQLVLDDTNPAGNVLNPQTFTYTQNLGDDPIQRFRSYDNATPSSARRFLPNVDPIVGFGFDRPPINDEEGIPLDPAIYPTDRPNARVGVLRFLAELAGDELISGKSGVVSNDNPAGPVFGGYNTFTDPRAPGLEVTDLTGQHDLNVEFNSLLVRVVPEPGTLLLLVSGLAGLALTRRQRF